MIERLDLHKAINNLPLAVDKINELVDFANGITKSMLEQTVIQLDGEKVKEIVAEPIFKPIRPYYDELCENCGDSYIEKDTGVKVCRIEDMYCRDVEKCPKTDSAEIEVTEDIANGKVTYTTRTKKSKPTEKMYTLDEVAEMIAKADSLTQGCGVAYLGEKGVRWCQENQSRWAYCTKDKAECWKHAIECGWLKGE